LILDELGELNPHDAGKCAYLLANGAGKIRSMTTGDARKKAEWLLYYLSSGEITLAEHMLEAGKTARAGQEVRHVDIPANAGAGLGLFEDIHGYENAAQFADSLRKMSAAYYGCAFPEFVQAFIDHQDEISAAFAAYTESFIERYVEADVVGQVRRVAGKFAVIAAAGKLATEWGITGWEADHVLEAVGKVFSDWLTNRSHSGSQEDFSIISQIRGYLHLYGDSRFIASHYDNTGKLIIDCFSRPIIRRDGYKVTKDTGNEYYILPGAFREICKGMNMATTLKFLDDNGYIVKAPDGRKQPQKRLPNIGQTRVYHLTAKIMLDDEVTEDLEAIVPENNQ
jgi:putative DNA primase/helicase